MLAGAAALLLVVAGAGGVALKNSIDKANAAEAKSRELQQQKDEIEQRTKQLQFELENTKDAQRIAELTQQLEAAKAKAQQIENASPAAAARPVARPAGGGGGATKPAQKPGTPCNCTPGDPLCSCL
jgi:colicin import membrane protein